MKFVGLIVILLGICSGIYLGFWVMFIGGIIDIIGEIKAVNTSTANVAVGILKIIFSGFVFWLTIVITIITGSFFSIIKITKRKRPF